MTDLRAFAASGEVRIAVGVDFGGTSMEGLTLLFDALEGRGNIWVVHDKSGPTFHPKVYLFKGDARAELIVGSGNLTEGGLFENYEASLSVELDLTRDDDRALLREVEAVLDVYEDITSGISVVLTRENLGRLVAAGYLPPEAHSRRAGREPAESGREEEDAAGALFGPVPFPHRTPEPERQTSGQPGTTAAGPEPNRAQVYYMTLMRTDAGTGQTTAGTQRRSPEIFIPLAARDFAPEFWGWLDEFTEDVNEVGKFDRTGVRMLIGARTESVTMTYFPHKHEFRIRSEPLRSAGEISDILRIEKTHGARGYDYIATVIPRDTEQYAAALAKCINQVTASRKVWGYE